MAAAAALPDWPTLMDEATAAAYLGMSGDTFRGFMARKGVRPVDLGGPRLTRWRRADLDRLVDSLPARGVPSPAEAAGTIDPAEAALAMVERQARAARRAGG